MLFNSTGNIYGINKENRLYLISHDDSFSGAVSETLISVINSGIESLNVYDLLPLNPPTEPNEPILVTDIFPTGCEETSTVVAFIALMTALFTPLYRI